MIAAIYFSPTDTSRKGAEAIAKALGDGEFLSIDVTRFDAEPERTEFGPEDAVVFGAPVYGGRLYRGCRERFRRFRGNGTPCIVTVTYGNRDYDDALLELFDLAREQGFVPAAAAALVGQHTYGSIQVGRPDASDLAQDREFAEKAAAGVMPIFLPLKLSSPVYGGHLPGNRIRQDRCGPRDEHFDHHDGEDRRRSQGASRRVQLPVPQLR